MLALLAFSGGLLAQTTKTWTAVGGGNWATGSNWSGGTAPVAGQIVVFDNGVSGQITNVPTITLAGLRVENTSNVELIAQTGGDRAITVSTTGGTTRFVVAAGSILTLGSGTSDIDIAFTRSGGTGNALAQLDGTIVVETGNVLDLNNMNTLTTVGNGGLIENTGGAVDGTTTRLVFGAGSTYIHGRNGDDIPQATWNTTSTVEITGVTTTRPGTLNQTFGNVIWNSPLQTDNESLAGELATINGNFTVTSTGTGDISLKNSGGGTTSTTVNGTFSISGGTVVFARNSETHNLLLNGDMIMSGGTLSRGSGNAGIVFDRTGTQSFTKTGGTITGLIAVRIDNGAIVDFGTSVLDGAAATFTVDADGHLIVANNDGIYSSGSTGAIQVGGTRTFSNDAIYEFRGARTGTFSTTGNDVQGLVINNTSGEVLLERPFDVTTSLTLTNGYATTGTTNIITVGTGGTSTSSNGAFVNGIIAKTQNNNTAFTFHVGSPSAGGLRPISLTSINGSGTSTFTAQFYRANPITSVPNGNVLGSGLARVSACEYWTLDRNVGGARNGVVTIDWVTASDCSNTSAYITNVLTLRVARHNGTSWVDAGATLVGGSTVNTGSIRTSAAQTQFSPFALASSNTADNPLPVLFDGVRAFGKNDGVQIEWSNLTERDIVRYEVERSANGIDFYSINEQAPKSNRDDKASYTHFDAAPLTGANYYRIRVDEIGGKAVYSKILRVEIGSTKKAGYSVYPNPVTGRQFTLSLNGLRQGAYTLQVLNASGMRVHTQVINNVGAGVTEMIQLPASLQTGVYITVVIGDNYRESKQLIVK